jgi:hypothetical protein
VSEFDASEITLVTLLGKCFGIDREKGLVVIKPSVLEYESMKRGYGGS